MSGVLKSECSAQVLLCYFRLCPLLFEECKNSECNERLSAVRRAPLASPTARLTFAATLYITVSRSEFELLVAVPEISRKPNEAAEGGILCVVRLPELTTSIICDGSELLFALCL